MEPIPEKIVNLDLPPIERWAFLSEYRLEMDELLSCYLSYISDAEPALLAGIAQYKHAVVPASYLEEIQGIAAFSRFGEDEILLANLYYDVLKFFFGCTAFALYTGETTFHCRNLDWPSDNDLLARRSMIFDFRRNNKTVYKTISWPGYIGALSGVKPGKFSLTLNAVQSMDKPAVAFPVSFLLRDVLAHAPSFEEARALLEGTSIICDCLILLSGTGPTERAVIERTPTRAAIRTSPENFLVVTNDYKKLENGIADNILRNTSCSRYDRSLELLRAVPRQTREACLNILRDNDVLMEITVQQMIFNNVTGEITLRRINNKKEL